jgi:hypothetical protein
MLEHDYVQRGAFQAGKPALHLGKASLGVGNCVYVL